MESFLPQSVGIIFLLSVWTVSDAAPQTGSQSAQQRPQTCRITASDIEGPYYKRNAPIQQITSPAVVPQVCRNSPANDRLILNGTIRQVTKNSPCGRPTRSVLDIWHANADGVYSDTAALSTDFACRTRLVTSEDGSFTFSSIFPGRYDDSGAGGFRPAHIHFSITPLDAANRATGKSLTTQMYFAQDHFLKPRDSCGFCQSGDATLITHVTHQDDIKTFTGTWDVLLAADNAN